MNSVARTLEYRFNTTPGEHECPLCGVTFRTTHGSWPFLTGTITPVCGGSDCPVEDAPNRSPCDTLFAFCPMEEATLEAIRRTDDDTPVAERLRLVGMDETLSLGDRDMLNRAALDLAYWEADMTRIASLEPGLVLQTCPEAAAEMLLSVCGDII
ncbi:hypothetical protein BH23GEM9_BH23GEM9_23970 [soil metagenome]